MKSIVQFGAGNIGRSLVGTIFSRAGYEIIFIDTQQTLIDALNKERCYRVIVKDNDNPDGLVQWVRNVRGIAANDRSAVVDALASAEYVCTAVGARAIPHIVPLLAQGLSARSKPLSVILCENMRGVSRIVRDLLEQSDGFDHVRCGNMIGLVETSIGKMVPIMPEEIQQSSPLEVWGEPYNQIIADGLAFVGKPPDIEGVLLKDNFVAWVECKLFVHNLGHAACAWHGFRHGKKFIWECLEDPWIYAEVYGIMRESGAGLVREYPNVFSQAQMDENIHDLLRRFANRALGDTIYRVGKDVERKLSADDRVIGALRLCVSHGIEPEHICRAAASALLFCGRDENNKTFGMDMDIYERVKLEGPWPVLSDICGLKTSTDLSTIERISSRYFALR